MKKLILSLLIIFALSFAQQAQAQETKEYVTVSIYPGWTKYAIAYPDGKVEEGKTGNDDQKNLGPHTKSINDIFNMLAQKGYKLVSSNSGSSGIIMYYIFEK